MKKEGKEFLRWIESIGLCVDFVEQRKGHLAVGISSTDGRKITYFTGTTSSDRRAVIQRQADVRRMFNIRKGHHGNHT